MSAADRIEAIADVVVSAEQAQEIAGLAKASPTVLRMMADLRAIAAELRGAPALTEAERDRVCADLSSLQKSLPNDGSRVTLIRCIGILRALRTERTPS